MKPFRYSAVELLVALGLLVVSAPFLDDLRYGDWIEALLITLVMISAVLAVGARHKTLVLAVVLMAPALIGKWITHLRPDLLHPAIYVVATGIFFAFVIAHLVAFVVRAPRVDANVLCAGISGFLMLGLLWMSAYLAVSRLAPAAFTVSAGAGAASGLDGFSAFYFSFITLCTVGYGDITPVSRVARMLAVTEAITGLFYMAVLISRLVSVYSSTPRAARPEEAG